MFSCDNRHGFENPVRKQQTCHVPGTGMAYIVPHVGVQERTKCSHSYMFMQMCVCYYKFLSKTRIFNYYDVSEMREKAFSGRMRKWTSSGWSYILTCSHYSTWYWASATSDTKLYRQHFQCTCKVEWIFPYVHDNALHASLSYRNGDHLLLT